MNYDVKLPDIGEGVAEGEIVRWLVKAGEAVREEQPLVEVMTDKASVEIPSPRTGTIDAIHVEEGAMVPVGTVIVSIAVAGGMGSAPAPAAHGSGHGPVAAVAASAPVAAVAAPAVAAGARAQATPAVRNLAKQLGVALETLSGSGPGGAITTDDVKRAAAGAGAHDDSAAASPAVAARAPAAAAHVARADEPETRSPLRGLRRRIAEHMRKSISTAAQFTFVAECDFTPLIEHRQQTQAAAARAGVKLTYLAYVFRAAIEPLQRFPLVNSSLDDATHEVVLKRYYHVGLATNTDDGLTVPILHHVDRMSLFGIAREIERLSSAARAHQLKVEELHGGTFTITSTGAQGGVLATPILHHPQVAILGVHEVKPKPAVVDGAIVIRSLGNLSLSLDHRVVDGAVGADFLYALIERLQNPDRWLTPGDLT